MSGPELYTVPYDERGVEQRLPAEPCTVSRCWAYRMAIVARRYAAWRVRNCDTNIFILKENMGRARRILAVCPYTYLIRSNAPDTRGTVNEYDRIYLELARVWRGYLVFCALGGC